MTRKYVLVGTFSLLAVLLFGSPESFAQINTGTILGTVADETGAVLPGATVRVTNQETGISRELVTDGGGRYRAPQLNLGRYEVEAGLSGFAKEVRQGIELTIGREAVVNFQLRIGEMTEAVTVTGEAATVQTKTSDIGGLVDDRQIRELPLNGRDLTQLVFLQTGVVAQRFALQSPNTGQGTRISAGGSRMNFNNFLIDGTRKNEFGNSTPGSVAGVQLGVDAIQEFRVISHNYSAEFGQTAGAIITAVTKSGTNALHGSTFYFHRNAALDADNYFDVGGKPDFTRHQTGFSFGGPVVRNRTFFFGAYEMLRERRGVTETAYVPSLAARNGQMLHPTTGLPVRVDPRVVPVLALYPLPNGQDLGDGSAVYTFAFPYPKDEQFFTVRLDHQFTSNFSLFGRYQFSDAERVDARGSGIYVDETTSRQQLATLQGTQILSSRLVNTFGVGYNRATPALDSVPTIPIDPSLTVAPGRDLPRYTISGIAGGAAGSAGGAITEIGPRNLDGGRWTTNSYQFKDDLNFTTGAHSFKAGGYYEWVEFSVVQRDINGLMRFSNLADFLQARPNRFQIESEDSERLWQQHIVGLYVQDDFSLNARLTLNVGVRWDVATAHDDKLGRNAVLLDPLDTEITVADKMYEPGKKNFQPRAGFAWNVTGDGRTSLRGGAGIFHNLMVGRADSLGLARNQPFGGTSEARNPPWEPAAALALVATAGLPRPNGWPYNLNVPTMYHYNFTFEKELGARTVARVGYVGSQGRFLATQRSGNTAYAQILPDGTKFFPAGLRVRNPAMAAIIWRNTDGTSSYNALEGSFIRRASGGLQFQVSYTFSKAIDDQSSTAGADNQQDPGFLLDPDDTKSDRGRTINDVRHNLVANFSYELPVGMNRHVDPGGVAGVLLGDWTVNGIFTAASGVPFTPLVGFNRSRNRDDRAPDRPNLAPGASANPVLGSPELWFDPTAFELPAAGTFGTLARNTIEGPGLAVLDLSLIKQAPVKGGRLEFRIEFFNILNRANFGLPEAVLFESNGSRVANAGRISSTVTTAREMQLGIKYVF